MKNSLKLALIICILTVANAQLFCNAAILDESYLQKAIIKDYSATLAKKVKGDVKVKVISIPCKLINVPDDNVKINVIDNSNYFSPRKIVKVNIYSNDTLVKSIPVSVSINVTDDVWVAKDYIKLGSAITNIELQKKDISLNIYNVLRKDDNIDKIIAKKMFKEGDIIDKRFIDNSPVVLRNSPVSVLFQSEDLTVSIDALSMESGKIGDMVKIKSKEYNKVYVGKVISTNTVLVEI